MLEAPPFPLNSPADERLMFYYVSMPSFRHRVFTCSGARPSEAHEVFYRAHYQKYGNGSEGIGSAPYTVHVLPYLATRITQDSLGHWIAFDGPFFE